MSTKNFKPDFRNYKQIVAHSALSIITVKKNAKYQWIYEKNPEYNVDPKLIICKKTFFLQKKCIKKSTTILNSFYQIYKKLQWTFKL